MFPDTVPGRLRWALREALVVAGILLFWVGAALALSLVAGLLRSVIVNLELEVLIPVYEALDRGRLLLPAAVPLTGVTATIYGLARVGTAVVDHYRATAG
ncbi:hypothetical protein [Halorarius halobius]|uniref:hypothetical protein n=1 Tax=Halorarius halobius TaxID=2962671 RepID=UPI0020CE22C2|nr:hypothetical protein [Halorarius halobius]